MQDYSLKNKRGFVLSEDQNEIVGALLKNDYYFNCAQTGFGKTLTTLTAAVHKAIERKEDEINFILLLPNSAVKAFTDTLSGQLGLPFNIFTASKTRIMKGARFHIFNYSSLPANLFSQNKEKTNPEFENFKRLYKEKKNLWLIADEAHMLQDPNTNQYKLVLAIRELFIGGWFLTATPLLNHLDGFFYMVDLLIPEFFKSIYAFRNKFQTFEEVSFWKTSFGRRLRVTKKVAVGYKNLDILKEMFKEIGIVKSKTYDVEFIYRSISLEKDTQTYYKRAAEGLFSGTKIGKSRKTKSKQDHAAARLHDIQRVVSNSHPDFKRLGKDHISEKEKLLLKTILEVIERGEATLVYFSYLETLERIKGLLKKYEDKLNISSIFEISGKVSSEVRRRVESAISPRSVVLITSAGTESVNLQKANNLIFYEIPFPLREFIQAGGRITRTDSNFSKFNIYILEAEGTIDTYKKSRILANSGAIKAVLGGSNILPTELLILTSEDKKAMKEEYLWWR